MEKYIITLTFFLFYNFGNAQNDCVNLLKGIWETDTCTLDSHRGTIAYFFVEKKMISNSEELVSLLGPPLQINYRNNGRKYYAYTLAGRRKYFHDCTIYSLILFEFNKKGELDGAFDFYLTDSEEDVFYWSSGDLPIESYEGDEKEPSPFKFFGELEIEELDKK